jgi:hypothetical protein
MGIPVASRVSAAELDFLIQKDSLKTLKDVSAAKVSKLNKANLKEKKSFAEYALILIVFAISGTLSSKLTRHFVIEYLGLNGNLA